MESTLIPPRTQTTEKAYPYELKAKIEPLFQHIKILSLDCFDTILWRQTATPIDVFFSLQHQPQFKKLGFSAFLRMRAETQARSLKIVQKRTTEVNLGDIYRNAFPKLTENEIENLSTEELAAEMEACYAHPAILECMRLAIANNIQIVIVSDTYLNKQQLEKLLKHCLPDDVASHIDSIFCSSDYGVSKSNGLFNHVLDKMICRSNEVLHIGDNVQADVEGAKKHNIPSCHLLHHKQSITDKHKLQSAASSLFNPEFRYNTPLNYPFRGLLANKNIDNAEQAIGYATIGPIMYAFAKYILTEKEELIKKGKKPKLLFLMRDANLPYRVCEAINGKPDGTRVRISRFASYAASFRTKADIDNYLITVLFSNRFSEISKQLLLPDEIIQPLLQVLAKSSNPLIEFINFVHERDIQNIIIKKSQLYKERLIKYLKKEINLSKGDTLVFIDLGYSGTAQRLLEPMFKEELDVEIIGRYLIELNIPEWEKSRAGLLDPSWCDERAMLGIVSHIALLEQICTSNEKSVIDYDSQGGPIFSDSKLSKTQQERLDKIQNECLLFTKDAELFFDNKILPIKSLREAAFSELARFLFLPTETELNYLESFEFDVNLGTTDVMKMFDSNAGLNSLRKRGIFFSFMEKNNKSMRTNFPAELRYAGMELVLATMAQYRFGLEFNYKDMSLRKEIIEVIAKSGSETVTSSAEGTLTYDGYFSLCIPISQAFTLTILFGKKYQWLEIESAEIINLRLFLSNADSLLAEDYKNELVFNEMNNRGGDLYECTATTSSITIPPLNKQSDANYLIRLIFRPIVAR